MYFLTYNNNEYTKLNTTDSIPYSTELVTSNNTSEKEKLNGYINKIVTSFGNRLGPNNQVKIICETILNNNWDIDVFIDCFERLFNEKKAYSNLEITINSITIMNLSYKKIKNNGIIQEGLHNSEHQSIISSLFNDKTNLIFGKKSFETVIFQGKFKYIEDFNETKLVHGVCKYNTGLTITGTFGIESQSQKWIIKEGKVQYPTENENNIVEFTNGTYSFCEELNSIYLTNGTRKLKNSIEKGEFEYIEALNEIKLKSGIKTLTSQISTNFSPTVKEIGTYNLDSNSKQWILKTGKKIFTSNYYTNGIYDFCEITNTNYLSYGIKVYEDGDIEEGEFQLNKDSKKFKLIKKTRTNFNYKH